MRIHTSTLTRQDFVEAARKAGVGIYRLNEHGSRSRRRAFDVIFEGDSNYGGAFGNQDYRSATWDQWGIALGVIFDRDPHATCYAYASAEDFNWQTANRFESLTQPFTHKRHRWNYQGTSPGGVYAVSTCECGAEKRHLIRMTWAEYQEAYA